MHNFKIDELKKPSDIKRINWIAGQIMGGQRNLGRL